MILWKPLKCSQITQKSFRYVKTCTFYILRSIYTESLRSSWQPLPRGFGGPSKNERGSRQRYSGKAPLPFAFNSLAPASPLRHLDGKIYTKIHIQSIHIHALYRHMWKDGSEDFILKKNIFVLPCYQGIHEKKAAYFSLNFKNSPFFSCFFLWLIHGHKKERRSPIWKHVNRTLFSQLC